MSFQNLSILVFKLSRFICIYFSNLIISGFIKFCSESFCFLFFNAKMYHCFKIKNNIIPIDFSAKTNITDFPIKQ